MNGHSAECLCDVIITTPVAVRYAFDQVWHADVVASAVGYDGESGGGQLADFLEALARGYDATRKLSGLDADWLDGIGDLRNRVGALLTEGESIVDLPSVIGDSFARIVGAITQGQPNIIWSWDESTWLRLEGVLCSSEYHVAQSIAVAFGVTWDMADQLIHLYGKSGESERRTQRHEQINAILERHPTAKLREIARLCDEAGIEVEYALLQSYRLRWLKKHPQAA